MKILKRVVIICIVLLLLGFVLIIVLFHNEIRSLRSLKKINEYGMYQITCYGDYSFDEYLKQGTKSTEETEDFIIKHLTKGLPISIKKRDNLCSSFTTHNKKGEVLFCRNFDYQYAPSAIVRTDPSNGYASISVSDIAFMGYNKDNLPDRDGISMKGLTMLAAPYLCIDGMNEKGLAIADMSVPIGDPPNIEGAPTLYASTMMRMVLEKAGSVDEAVNMMKRYNIYFYKGDYIHFLLADSTGRSVVVEYVDQALQVIETDRNYQISTNFIQYGEEHLGIGQDRYDKIEETLEAHNGILEENEALDLLKEVGIPGRIQWSVVYNLTTGKMSIFPSGHRTQVEQFHINRTSVER